MSDQMTLNLHEHDLPPEWDGEKVTWEDDWRAGPPMFICPPPDPEVCRTCGRIAPTAYKRGLLPDRQAWGRTRYNQITKRPAGHRVLFAFRCTHCGTDDVVDHTTGECWSLGPEDYGPRGSYLQEVKN